MGIESLKCGVLTAAMKSMSPITITVVNCSVRQKLFCSMIATLILDRTIDLFVSLQLAIVEVHLGS